MSGDSSLLATVETMSSGRAYFSQIEEKKVVLCQFLCSVGERKEHEGGKGSASLAACPPAQRHWQVPYSNNIDHWLVYWPADWQKAAPVIARVNTDGD